mgnify:FL=1|jgi:hypothetical protein
MLLLFVRKVGDLTAYGLKHTLFLSLGASLAMAPFVVAGNWGIEQFGLTGFEDALLQVGLASGLGVLIYIGLMRLMGLEELNLLRDALIKRLKKKQEQNDDME